MSIEQAIRKSEELSVWLDKNIHGLDIGPEKRFRLAAGCLDAALEHHRAVVLLIKHRLYGTAFAVVRLLFEATVRGVWLHKCASNSQVDLYEKDELDYRFGDMIHDIEKLPDFSIPLLSSVTRNLWKGMSSYIHTGSFQAIRRNTKSAIEPNYSKGEIINVIDWSNLFALFTAMAIAVLTENEPLLVAVLEKQNSLVPGTR